VNGSTDWSFDPAANFTTRLLGTTKMVASVTKSVM
jgi:hypothetical protein